jgi:protein-export SecD/SecF family membrane protein
VGDAKRRVAIVLDGEVISSPQVNEGVQCNIGIQGGRTDITGDFTQAEADELAVLIKGGALPVPVTIIASSTVGPTLGQDAIDASVRAGIIGLTLTAIFLVVVYRFVGFLAAVALASYGLISYGALVALGATLTLPGLGGLLLSAGLAIDANVLVFERAREEYAASRSKRLMPALDNGFAKAFSAIADSNVTTLLAAGLLFFLASGPVRGFGVTLVIGVLASIVSALLVTRVLTEFGLKRGWVSRRPASPASPASAASAPGWRPRSPTSCSTRGPTSASPWRSSCWRSPACSCAASTSASSSPAAGRRVRDEPGRLGVRRAGGRRGGRLPDRRSCRRPGENIAVRTTDISEQEVEEIRTALAASAGEVTVASNELIGPDARRRAAQQGAAGPRHRPGGPAAYLAVRFRWTMAAGTVLAMLHDVVLVIGIFAWLGQADRRRLPRRGPDHHRCVGERLGRHHGPRPRDVVAAPQPAARAGGQRRDHRAPRRAPSTPASAPSSSSAPDRARRPVADRLRPRPAHRPVRRHVLLGVRRRAADCCCSSAQQRAAADARSGARPRRPPDGRPPPAPATGSPPGAGVARGWSHDVGERTGRRAGAWTSFNTILLASSALLLVAVVSVRLADRSGLPSLLVYLGVGLAVGEAGLGIQFEDYEITAELGLLALALILAEGGLTTRWAVVRPALPFAVVLATVGVAVSVAVVAGLTHLVLGVDTRTAVILGSIVASTDAAAVFSVLRKLPLRARVRAVLEAESGLNDAPVVVLVVLASSDAWATTSVLEGPGDRRARAGRRRGARPGARAAPGASCCARVALPAAGLYPLATVALCLLAFAAGQELHVSGFLGVYLAALVLGNSTLPHRRAVLGFAGLHRAARRGRGCSSCSGLLASPDRLLPALPDALLIGAAATFLARPLAVVVSALPFRMPWREQAFLSWAGLRGAVPIVIATIPVTEGLPGRDARRRRRVRPRRRLHAGAGADPAVGSAGGSASPWSGTRSTSRSRSRRSSSSAPTCCRCGSGPARGMHGVYVEELRLPQGAHVTLIVRDGPEPGARPAHPLRARRPGARRRHQRGARGAEARLRAVARGGKLARWQGVTGAEGTPRRRAGCTGTSTPRTSPDPWRSPCGARSRRA